MVAALAPLAVVALIDAWIYDDANRRAAAGRPVTARIGNLVIGTPNAWLIGSMVLFWFVWPLYWTARRG